MTAKYFYLDFKVIVIKELLVHGDSISVDGSQEHSRQERHTKHALMPKNIPNWSILQLAARKLVIMLNNHFYCLLSLKLNKYHISDIKIGYFKAKINNLALKT